MDAQLSPSYSHEKLSNPSFVDLVDVFEDLWRNFVFSPARVLLNTPHGDVAAMTVLCSYFEAIAAYITGEDSDRRSKEFFVRGFCRVFCSESAEIHKAAEHIYKYIRCRLAHEGMLSHKVNYSRAGAQSFFLTYRKAPDGSLDIGAGVVSIIVNPLRMYQGIEQHFEGYVRQLRASEDKELCEAFQRTVDRQWALGTVENIVGMTEEEFLARA